MARNMSWALKQVNARLRGLLLAMLESAINTCAGGIPNTESNGKLP